MITVLVHSDLDGCGAAVLARIAFEDVEIRCCNYEDIDKYTHLCLDQGETKQLFIVDISPQSKAVYKRLDELHTAGDIEIVCLDHHATSVELVDHPWGLHDDTSCGTGMFLAWLLHYDYLVESDELARFALAVWAYDTWQLDSDARPRGEMLHRLYSFMGRDRFIATFVDDLDADTETVIEELDEMLLDQQKRYIEEVIETQFKRILPVDSKGRGYSVTHCEENIFQVGSEILTRFPRVLYAVNLRPASNTCQICSRKGGVDVSEIAKSLGGGGHPSAAGFPMLLREVLFVEIHKRLQGLPD